MKKKAAVQTGLDFFSPAVLPFLHFLSARGEKKAIHTKPSGPTWLGNRLIMNILSLQVTLRRHKEARGLSTYSLSRGMMVRDTQEPRISLPAAQWVSSPGLVLLCHTLPTAAKNGPLGQRMPSSSSVRSHVFFQKLPQDCGTRSWKGSLGCQPVLSPKETGQSDCHLPQPSGRRKLLSKNMFLLRIFPAPLGVAQRSRLSLTSLPSSPLGSCCSLWPPVPVFHTAVYYFDQYPPFPLLSLPLSPP